MDGRTLDYFKIHTSGVAGHSRDGGFGHTLKTFIIISVMRKRIKCNDPDQLFLTLGSDNFNHLYVREHATCYRAQRPCGWSLCPYRRSAQ